jgi:O-antigen ligase
LLLGVGLLAVVFLFQLRSFRNLVVGLLTIFLLWAIWYTFPILTTLVAVAVALMSMIPLLHARRVQRKFKWPLIGGYLLAGIAAIVLFWSNRGPVLALVGEDSTMSLRTVIWAYYWEAVMWRPVIGPGWGNSYGWNPIERDRLQQVSEFFPAHNGFIDTALMLGLVGLALLVATLVSLSFAGISRAVVGEFPLQHSFIPVLVVYLSLNDMMATSLPKFIGIFLLGLMSGLLLRVPSRDPAGRDMLVNSTRAGVEHQQGIVLTEK